MSGNDNHNMSIMKPMLRIKPSNEPSVIKIFLQYILSEVGLLLVIVLYALLGANIYIDLECEGEDLRYKEKQEFGAKVEESLSYMSIVFYDYALKKNMSRDEFENKVDGELRDLISMILEGIEGKGYDGEVNGWEKDWTFSKSLLFTISIMTSIGYGHIAPKTFYGQILTLPYSLIGIGVFMVFLAKVGNVLARVLKYSYSQVLCRPFISKKKRLEEQIGVFSMEKDELYEEDSLVLPLSLSVFVLCSYLVLGSWLFSLWEDWDMMSSFYFTFITLTTIGFGDLSPSFDTSSWRGKIKILLVMIYVVCGMALISMVISLLQERATKKAEDIVQSLKNEVEENQREEFEEGIHGI
ncbi:TWiK family of potassium channels protein 7-like [Lepeophtheirus salmonis]|uniref:TWiK family of potassium channels protein 7-like n=1 Tax=Lepeophtheirus salmonis TaxID=72036 RepID=UPI001AE5F383|nr:TWiK family of potassium channels protein 7-like [Lepeophtheirus salmonis]